MGPHATSAIRPFLSFVLQGPKLLSFVLRCRPAEAGILYKADFLSPVRAMTLYPVGWAFVPGWSFCL